MQPSPTTKQTIPANVYFALADAVKAWMIRKNKQNHAQKHNPNLPVRDLHK